MVMATLLPENWEVPQEFRDRLSTRVGRQRSLCADDHLLLVLHKAPKPDEWERAGRFFWRSPDGSWTSSDLGAGPLALSKHLDEYADQVERLDQMEERAESTEEYFKILEALGPLHRAMRHLHRVLTDARKLVPEDRNLIDARDQAYEIERNAELLVQETQQAVDFTSARRAEEQAGASHKMAVAAHRLNLLAAFFFPVATLSAIFGMNLPCGLESLNPPGAFLILLVVGLVIGSVLTLFIVGTSDRRMPPRKGGSTAYTPRVSRAS